MPPTGLRQGICNALLLKQGAVCQRFTTWEALPGELARDALLWLDLNWEDATASDWLLQQSGLPENSCLAALSENTRPRSFSDEEGNLVLILRVVNAQASAPGERLVSLRLLISRNRIISLCRYQPLALDQFRLQIENGGCAQDPAELITLLLHHVQQEIEEVVFTLAEELNQIEEQLDQGRPPLEAISAARKSASQLHRYLAPQRGVLGQVRQHRNWFGEPELQSVWRELENALQLSLEEVELAASRLLILQDEVRSSLNEHTNRTLYLLSLVTFFFLPLSFITGFLGMNVVLPGMDTDFAFWVVLGVILGISLGQWWLIRRLRWL